MVPHFEKRLFVPLTQVRVPIEAISKCQQDKQVFEVNEPSPEHLLLARELYEGLPERLDASFTMGPEVELASVAGCLEPIRGVDIRWSVSKAWVDAVSTSLKTLAPHLGFADQLKVQVLRKALKEYKGFDRQLRVTKAFPWQLRQMPMLGVNFDLDQLIDDVLSLPYLPKKLLAGDLKQAVREFGAHFFLRQDMLQDAMSGLEALHCLPSEELIEALTARAVALDRLIQADKSVQSNLLERIEVDPTRWIREHLADVQSEADVLAKLDAFYRQQGGYDLFAPVELNAEPTSLDTRRLNKMKQLVTEILLPAVNRMKARPS